MKRLVVSLLVGAALLATSPVARGGDDVAVAAETFRTGTAAYARGDFRAAALSFELSNRLAPHAVALYNAGLAWEAAGEKARAADAYDAALGDGQLDHTQHADAKKRLAALRSALGRARITAPSGAVATIAHLERASLPRRVHLSPGVHELTVTFQGGREDVRTIEVAAGGEVSVDVREPAAQPAAPSPPPSTPSHAPSAAAPDAAEGGGSTQLLLGLVIAGVGTGGIAMGAVTGAMALGARDDFEASGRRDAAAHDRAATLRTLANVGFFAGGALAAGGLVLVLTAPSGTRNEPAVAVSLGPTGGTVHGRF